MLVRGSEVSSRRARNAVLRFQGRMALEGHDWPMRLWDGTEVGPPNAGWRLVLHHPWSLRSLLWPPNDLNAGEAYVHDHVDVDGDLVAALHAVSAVREAAPLALITRAQLLRRLLALPRPPERSGERRIRALGRRHTRARDRQVVQHHYDVGNDFYSLFLDRDLVYSCAYFAPGDATPASLADDAALDRAQQRKLELVCRKLGLRPGATLLDIGCGWGSLVIHAARNFGVQAVGVTLSERQADLARQRVAAAGLADRVEIRLQDYRDVGGAFDAVASVGMFEHVGSDQFATYFATVYRLTAPGGRFLNHAITTGERREVRDLADAGGSFVGTYVFPDGALAPASLAVDHVEEAGFELVDVEQLRPHYALTLRHWVRRLEEHAVHARDLVGEQTYRVWRAYMAGSVVGFESGELGVVQVLGSKGAALPLGRTWMQPRSDERSSLGR